MSQQLGFEQRQENGRRVIVLTGEIDLRSSPDLRTKLIGLCREIGSDTVLLDLSGVSYVDSSGVGTLVEFKRRLKQSNGDVILLGMQPRVKSVFEITRLDQFFQIVDSRDEVN